MKKPSSLPRTFAVAFLAVFLSTGDPGPARAEPPPSREQIESLIKDMLKTWETGDAEKFAAAFDEKALFAYPGDRLGKAQLVGMFKSYHQDKSDIKIYFGPTFLVEDNRFACIYQFAATDRKSGVRQAVGTAATGSIDARKKYVNRQLDPVRGRVNELDELTAKNAKMIADVDARATEGIRKAMSKANEADTHALDAGNRANQAQQTAQQAHTRIARSKIRSARSISTSPSPRLKFASVPDRPP